MTYLRDLDYYDELYLKPVSNLPPEEIVDFIELMAIDFENMLAGLNSISGGTFGISHENKAAQDILKFRRLNRLMEQVMTAAEELKKL